MSAFKELDPAVARRAIEGYVDEISAEAAALDKFYQRFSCPRQCGPLTREIDVRHTFSDPSFMTPRALLRCSNCRYLVDPHTNIVLDSGNAAKIPVESSPILQPGRKRVE